MFSQEAHGRRAGDTLLRRRLDRWRDAVLDGTSGPVAMGRALLIMTGTLTCTAAPLLHPGRDEWLTLLVVSAAMLGALGVSYRIPWRRLPTPAMLVFPVLALAAFTALGLGGHGTFAPIGGFFTLCFGYAGLTQKPGRTLALVPLAGVALVALYGRLDAEVSVRLVVAISAWVVLAEVLAAFVARLKALTASLESAAHRDALTGLPNRRDLDLRLAACEAGTAVVIFDLDHFKALNDTQGHAAGDRVLADFGALLREGLRHDDYAARFGGEEFVVLLPSVEDVDHVLDRLRARWQLLRPDVTFSAGVAECRADRPPLATLEAADAALYRAKAGGRDTYVLEPVLQSAA